MKNCYSKNTENVEKTWKEGHSRHELFLGIKDGSFVELPTKCQCSQGIVGSITGNWGQCLPRSAPFKTWNILRHKMEYGGKTQLLKTYLNIFIKVILWSCKVTREVPL